MVPVEALVSADVGGVEDGKREAGETAHVYFVRCEAGSRADGVVVRTFDVRELYVPIGLLFVSDHGEHEGHGVVDAFDAAVGARMVGACGYFVDA